MKSTAWFASCTRLLTASVAVICLLHLPAPLWSQSQWSGSSPGPIYYNSGNVGIGTTSPLQTLHVQGSLSVSTPFTPSSQFVNIYNDGSPRGYIEAGFGSFGLNLQASYAGGDIRFNTGGANERLRITPSGNVGIGTSAPQYKLSVNGTIQAKEVIVNNGWADYVFKPNYRLRKLNEVAAYINTHHHLPDIPSEKDVREKGIPLGEMQAKLLAKIEELTLHMIQANERNDRLEQQNRELQGRVGRLEAQSSTRGIQPAQRQDNN